MSGLYSRFTPVRSPESNGMAGAFVKTFKRDYAHIHERPDAKKVLSQLHGWFADYNERHPCKGLRMKSPREFIRSPATAGGPISQGQLHATKVLGIAQRTFYGKFAHMG